jgi:hypothetical protein
MDFLERYFWFFCGAFWVTIAATSLRARLAESVRRNHVSAEEATGFANGVAISVGSVCFALGAVALAADYPSPFCAQPFSFRDWASAATNLITLAAWAALLSWVWLGSGADLLGRVAPAFLNRPNYDRRYSPRVVRVAITAMLVVSAFGAFAASRSMPRYPICDARLAN